MHDDYQADLARIQRVNKSLYGEAHPKDERVSRLQTWASRMNDIEITKQKAQEYEMAKQNAEAARLRQEAERAE